MTFKDHLAAQMADYVTLRQGPAPVFTPEQEARIADMIAAALAEQDAEAARYFARQDAQRRDDPDYPFGPDYLVTIRGVDLRPLGLSITERGWLRDANPARFRSLLRIMCHRRLVHFEDYLRRHQASQEAAPDARIPPREGSQA